MGSIDENGGPVRPYREFGAWLRSRRLARRITQAELARLLAYEVSYVRKVEWGTRRPSQAFLARTAQVFDIPADAVPAPDFGAKGPQLPVLATELIGRVEEITAVVDFLETARLVTLVGAPGIGKTRLAIEVARVFEDRLEHGSTFVALDSVGAATDVPPAVARALGLAAGARASEQAVVDHLRPRRALLVCDNFEHVLEAASFVADVLAAAPGVRVLVTSREPLHLTGEARYVVPPLAFPDPDALPPLGALADWPAIALFLARARLMQSDFSVTVDNAWAVAATCAALDGVPLAIELTASAIRLFTSEAILERIDGVIHLPTSPPRDVAVRQRSVIAAIDWSFERLTEQERAVFARLSVFTGGFSMDAASAACADVNGLVDRRDATRIVASLVEKSLVGTRSDSVAGIRLVLLEVVRQYARDRLQDRGETDEQRRRHAEYFADWTESLQAGLTGVDQARHLVELDEDGPNLRVAVAWAVAHEPLLALRLCGATWRWWMRRHVVEGRSTFEAALAAGAAITGDEAAAARVEVLNGAGVLSATVGDYEAALAFLRPAMAMARDLGLDDTLALTHLHTGIVAEARGRYDEAAVHFDAAAGLYASLPDPRGLAHALNAVAAVATDTGDHERATELYEQSLDAFRRLGDRWSEALVTANLGWAALALERPLRAQAWYEQSLAAWRAVGDDRGVAAVLAGMARAGRQLDAPSREVAGRLEEALLLLAKVGDRRGVVECLEELAGVAADTGDWMRAGVLVGVAAAQRRITSAALSPGDQARLERLVDEVRRQLGPEQAEAAAAQGEALPLDQAVDVAIRRPSVSPGV